MDILANVQRERKLPWRKVYFRFYYIIDTYYCKREEETNATTRLHKTS